MKIPAPRDIGRLVASAFLAAAIAWASAAAASIPVGIRLIVVSLDPHDQAVARGFATILEEYAAFRNEGSPVYREPIVICQVKPERQEECVRQVLEPGEKDKELPPVIVLVKRTGDNQFEWRCIGVGEAAYAPARQTISLDMSDGLLGSPGARFEERKKAADCILSAASEAGGRVRL